MQCLLFQLLTGISQMCNRVEDQPQNSNFRAETYGPGSRCIEHGRQWTENGVSPPGSMYGGGCYQVWLCINMHLPASCYQRLYIVTEAQQLEPH